MNKEFIPYEQALELKELGFDEPCLDVYNKYGKLWGMRLDKQSFISNACAAPLYQQAFRWFRENGYDNSVTTYSRNSHEFSIIRFNEINITSESFYTYEEAELDCLKKLIEIVKNK